jgi:Large polyvalent protein-associated domain 7
MSQTGNNVSKGTRAKEGRDDEQENSLRPARRRAKTPVIPVPSAVAAEGKKERPAKRAKSEPVPDEVRKKFVQIKNAYFFADGAKAFTDRGDRLTTPSENTEVIRSLVTIAQARGWNEVVVHGSERFRREAWAAARTAGLDVQGYKPTDFEQSRLVRSIADRSAPGNAGRSASDGTEGSERSSVDGPSDRGTRSAALLAGTLVEHGRAPYQHNPKEPLSYYVKIETPKGDRTVWGVDLERAFKESLSQPVAGDLVGLRSIRQEPVKVKTPERDGEGKVVGQKDLETHRNRWIVEKQAFFDERAQAARTLRDPNVDAKQGGRRHPELTGSYLQVHAAELAAKQLRDPQDQKRFVEKVREALAASVARGEPLPPVRLREELAPEVRSRPARTPEPAHARG